MLKRMIVNIKNKNAKCYSNKVSINAVLKQNSIVHKNVNIVTNSIIGEKSYIGQDSIIDNRTIIGKYCSIGPQVYIAPGNHPLEYITTHPFIYDKIWNKEKVKKNVVIEDTIIGNDVWIGARAIIMAGVKIGNGAVIGSGAIVTKNVPDYAIVVGVPAKIVSYRFTEYEIEYLNKLKWWDWDEEKIYENLNFFTEKLTVEKEQNEKK